ncbi:10 kDa chaperonin-like [Tripterygium wilfordii]|uniref:Protein groES n=1 Tax=Tripterygium wilfordii TaxID=458696 RepID=A0A7J7DFM0_TRIWF|nr:10 kDa chaperonin-like [Tripterygium wilfordii]
MAKRLLPTLNRVLIEKIVPPTKTNAGILLPEKSSKLNSGKVVAVGPGGRDREGKVIPVSVKEGDTVLLPDYGGTEVKLGEKELVERVAIIGGLQLFMNRLEGRVAIL